MVKRIQSHIKIERSPPGLVIFASVTPYVWASQKLRILAAHDIRAKVSILGFKVKNPYHVFHLTQVIWQRSWSTCPDLILTSDQMIQIGLECNSVDYTIFLIHMEMNEQDSRIFSLSEPVIDISALDKHVCPLVLSVCKSMPSVIKTHSRVKILEKT